MNAHGVNAVVEVVVKTTSSYRPADVFVNRLRYRATASADTSTFAQWKAALDAITFGTRFFEPMPTGYYCSELSFTLIHPVEDIHEVEGYDESSAPYSGGQWTAPLPSGFDPALCAVVTRKSYKPGRQGIGHVYWGPIGIDYVSSGYLKPDPVGFDNLSILLDCLGDPLTVNGTTYKPCILPQTITAVDSQHDTRSHYFAAHVVQRKSRRAGIGS